ncbi:MAG: tRNA(His) guanylyltransferase Thg1 family protein [Pyrobaculum sp.]
MEWVLGRILREDPRSAEARYRQREAICEPSTPPLVVRLDGVGFGKRLKDFPTPRSQPVHRALVETAREVAATYGAELAYVVSDEINLAFLKNVPYGGRTFKIVSVLAGHMSAGVTARLARLLYFDGRVVKLDGPCDVARYVFYRARVGLNNYLVKKARSLDLVYSQTPHIGELAALVGIEDYELAWGTAVAKGEGYREEKDLCKALSQFCKEVC